MENGYKGILFHTIYLWNSLSHDIIRAKVKKEEYYFLVILYSSTISENSLFILSLTPYVREE